MHWITDGSIRHPWWVIGLIGAMTLAFIAAVPIAGIQSESDFQAFLPASDPATQLLRKAESTYGSQDLFLVALVAEETIFKSETLTKFNQMEATIADVPGVDDVVGPATADVIYGTEDSVVVEEAMPSVPQTSDEIAAYRERVMSDRTLVGRIIGEDGAAGAISVTLESSEVMQASGLEQADIVKRIRKIAAPYEGPEKLYLAGEPVVRTEIGQGMTQDLRTFIPLGLLILTLVIFASFRSPQSVVAPLSVMIIGTLWAFGTLALAGGHMTPFALIMPVMLIAIGVADGVHIQNKFVEELQTQTGRERPSKVAIVRNTMAEMAPPVVMTSLTTAAGFLGLMTAFLWPIREVGLFTAIGILYAMVLSLTLVPALLALMPLPTPKTSGQPGLSTRALGQCARLVSWRPSVTLIVGLLLTGVFAIGIPNIRVETRPDQFMGPQNPAVVAMEAMDAHFGGSRQVAIEIDTGKRNGIKNPAVLQKITELETFLLNQPEIGETSSVAEIARQLNETFHASDPDYYRIPEDPRLASSLFLLHGGDPGQLFLGDFSKGEVLARMNNIGSSEIEELVREIRAYLEAEFNGPNAEAEVVGATQAFASLNAKMVPSQLASLGTSTAVIGVIVALLMGSLLAGLISLVPLAATLIVAFGLMALLGIDLDLATLMLGSIAIGIGVDYVIHFLSRLRLERDSGREPAAALHATLTTTGRGIAYNTLALAFGFMPLLVSSFQGLFNFGLILIVTTLVASITTFTLIPAMLLLKGLPRFLQPSANRAGTLSRPSAAPQVAQSDVVQGGDRSQM